MSSFDEQDLGQRVDQALATITSGPAPAAAIVARGRRIRQRHRAARAGVAVVAAAVIAVAIPVVLGAFGHSLRPEQPPAAPALYVYGFDYPGSYGGTVTPINTATGTPGTPIHVWRGHLGAGEIGQIAITPDGKTAYVTGPPGVTPISTATGTPGPPIHIPGGYIRAIAITPDGKTAYVTTWSGTVTPISTATNTPGTPIHVRGGPSSGVGDVVDRRAGVGQIAITPDGKTAYVTGPGTVTPIDTATNTPGKPIHIGQVVTSSGMILPSVNVAITPDGKTTYVINQGGKVTPIDTATNKPGTPIPAGSAGLFAGSFAISPDGKTAYAITMSGCLGACLRPTVIVTPINTATDTAGTPLKFHVTTRGPFGQIAITPDGKTAYVTTGSTVTPINTATNIPGTPIHLAGPARFLGLGGQIVITPDGKTAYVTQWGSGTITPISTATNTPGKPIHVAAPFGVIAITP